MPPQESADQSPAAARHQDPKPEADGCASRAYPALLAPPSPPPPSPPPPSPALPPAALPPAPPPATPVMDFDDLLPHVGEFGAYQKALFVLLAPFACFVAFVYFAQIFITLTPERHWCRVPQLEHRNLTRDQRLSLAIPRLPDGSFDRCRMFAVDDWDALLSHVAAEAEAATEAAGGGVPRVAPDTPTVPCRFGWEFDMDEVPYKSIAAELEWVCDAGALPSVAQAVFFGGAIVGGLVFGWVADRFGRIPALLGTNLIGCGAGVATYFVSSFWEFCVCRFMVGLAFDNCFTMMYILVLEYVGPRWRTFVANMSIALYFTLASCLLPWIAYWVADWRTLCLVTSAPLALVLLAPAVVPESARWLVSQGRVDEAIKIMKKFEVINGKKVDPKIYEEFSDCVKKLQQEDDCHEKAYSVLDLFRTPRLRRITLLLIVIWMAVSLCFDGHVRSVGSLGLDVFVTFTVACATELPADTLLTLLLDRWGRRWLAFASLATSGLFSLLASGVPAGVPSAALAIAGRFSVNISYNIGLQYAAELLPTVVRAQGVALVHIMGYVATVLSPFIVYLANVSAALPLVTLGLLGVGGGLLSLLLPETLHEELPLTLQDGENFGRGQRLLDSPCWKRAHDGDADAETGRGGEEAIGGAGRGEAPPAATQSFQRGFARASMRASIRGETYRSSKIQTHRSSVIRRSVRHAAPADAAPADAATDASAPAPGGAHADDHSTAPAAQKQAQAP